MPPNAPGDEGQRRAVWIGPNGGNRLVPLYPGMQRRILLHRGDHRYRPSAPRASGRDGRPQYPDPAVCRSRLSGGVRHPIPVTGAGVRRQVPAQAPQARAHFGPWAFRSYPITASMNGDRLNRSRPPGAQILLEPHRSFKHH